MLSTLFIFRGHSTWERASFVCNDEKDNLFHSAGQHRNLCKPQVTQEKLGGSLGKNEGKWTGKAEISSRKKFRQQVRHAWLYSDLLQTLKGEPLSSGFSTDWSLNSVLHCGEGKGSVEVSEDKQ